MRHGRDLHFRNVKVGTISGVVLTVCSFSREGVPQGGVPLTPCHFEVLNERVHRLVSPSVPQVEVSRGRKGLSSLSRVQPNRVGLNTYTSGKIERS